MGRQRTFRIFGIWKIVRPSSREQGNKTGTAKKQGAPALRPAGSVQRATGQSPALKRVGGATAFFASKGLFHVAEGARRD